MSRDCVNRAARLLPTYPVCTLGERITRSVGRIRGGAERFTRPISLLAVW